MNQKSLVEVGEVRVWVTGLSLALGILMIVWLLFVVTTRGLSAFWPHRIMEIELDAESPVLNGRTVVAGARVEHRNTEEYLFIGNREVYGQSYVYIDSGDIEGYGYPLGIIQAERQRYGDGIFYPVALIWPTDERLHVDEMGFADTLHRLVLEAQQRRKRIEQLERGVIGRLNNELAIAQRKLRHLRRTESASQSSNGQQALLESQIAELEAEYLPLAEEARALRDRQREIQLLTQVATGEQNTMSVGDIHSYYYANDVDFSQRVAIFFQRLWRFISTFPREANTEGGILPAIFGTLVMTLIMSAAVMPFGVVAAVYLHEYSQQGFFVRLVRIAVNNLAGVPSIVFGMFGLGFFIHVLGGSIDQLFFINNFPDPTFKTPGILWASLTLALLTLPIVIVTTEEALSSIPIGVREGAYACGAGKWQAIRDLVLPAASPGILTALILAMARGAGEVAPLILTGVVALAPNLPMSDSFPFVHLERQFMHLGFHIYDLGFQSPDSEAARPMVFATTLILILIILALNLVAMIARERLKYRHQGSTF